MKSVPVSVTLMPPAAGPDVGAIAPTVGTGPVAIVRIPDVLVLVRYGHLAAAVFHLAAHDHIVN